MKNRKVYKKCTENYKKVEFAVMNLERNNVTYLKFLS